MSTLLESAQSFFEACETGQGWAACKAWCHDDAGFSAQTGALAGIDSLEGYTDWMKNILTPIPDGRYEVRFFGVDEARQSAAAYGVFQGTHTGPGGPVEPTGRSFSADYVYVMQFEDGRIRHMTKIWNDAISLQQLGWA